MSSQVEKVLQVLDLFSDRQITLSAEGIAEQLQISRPTAFRYVRQLCDAGMLARLSGRYGLGARIIRLDHQIRACDPILLVSRASLKSLASMTGCSAVLCSIFGDQVILVHRERGPDDLTLDFERGAAMPLFRGAVSKVILAHLTPARLRRIYEAHGEEPDALKLGADWAAFSRHFRVCRKQGYYLSRGEVQADMTGIAAPIFNSDGLVIGGLGLVFESLRSRFLHEDVFAELVMRHAGEVSARLAGAEPR